MNKLGTECRISNELLRLNQTSKKFQVTPLCNPRPQHSFLLLVLWWKKKKTKHWVTGRTLEEVFSSSSLASKVL